MEMRQCDSSINSKYVKTKNNLTFLLRCRDKDIIPNGLKVKLPSLPSSTPSINKILHQASTRILKHQVQNLRRKKALLEDNLQKMTSNLEDTLDTSLFETSSIDSGLRFEVEKFYSDNSIMTMAVVFRIVGQIK